MFPTLQADFIIDALRNNNNNIDMAAQELIDMTAVIELSEADIGISSASVSTSTSASTSAPNTKQFSLSDAEFPSLTSNATNKSKKPVVSVNTIVNVNVHATANATVTANISVNNAHQINNWDLVTSSSQTAAKYTEANSWDVQSLSSLQDTISDSFSLVDDEDNEQDWVDAAEDEFSTSSNTTTTATTTTTTTTVNTKNPAPTSYAHALLLQKQLQHEHQQHIANSRTVFDPELAQVARERSKQAEKDSKVVAGMIAEYEMLRTLRDQIGRETVSYC